MYSADTGYLTSSIRYTAMANENAVLMHIQKLTHLNNINTLEVVFDN